MKNQTVAITEFKPSEAKVSALNVRAKKNVDNVQALAQSIKEQGQLQPVVVRLEDGQPAILAGQRRHAALCVLEKEYPDLRLKAIVVDVDDAQASAISLSENVNQSAMTFVDVWRGFAGLVKNGWTVETLSQVYSRPEKEVRCVLALGDLLPTVLTAYEKDDIDKGALRILAVATKSKVREWVKLYRAGEDYPCWASNMRQFVYAAQSAYQTDVALFDVESSGLAIINDLFNDKCVFADSTQFWEKQHEAVELEKQALLDAQWSDVVILNDSFNQWQYVTTTKKDGGKVFISFSHDGSVNVDKGFLTEKEYAQIEKAKQSGKDVDAVTDAPQEKPEITNAMREYLLLYLTQSARTSVQRDNKLASRVLATLILTQKGDLALSHDSSFSRVSDATDKEIEKTPAYKAFMAHRKVVLKTIKSKPNWKSNYTRFDTVFKHVAKLTDKQVADLLSVLTADLLTVFCESTVTINTHVKPDMAAFWSVEQGRVFFEKIRNKEALLAIIKDIAGKEKAWANETNKVAQIRDNLITVTQSVKRWVPKYLSGSHYDNGVGTPFEK